MVALATPGTYGGFTASIRNSSDTAGTRSYFTCAAVTSSTLSGSDYASSLFDWSLADATVSNNATAADVSGRSASGKYNGSGGTTSANPTACPRDTPASAYVLNGTADYVASTLTASSPTALSYEAWINPAAAGGTLFSITGTATCGANTISDRQLYLDTSGQLRFVTCTGGVQKTLTASTPCTNGTWYHVVATFSATGSRLYLNGALVGSDSTMNAGSTMSGVWRVGNGTETSLTGIGASAFFKGSMRFAAIYSAALPQSSVTAHYQAGI
jgi:hypothetical protein